ncbi:hypothetical protein FE257_007657 [Aspergillus nanangensis]|uniref:DNA replication factor Cdt1 C-terminal domain-containing protein n=1 Tax=Aspergillus nanangensis TaxID=2582783 RepID=A0AAD4GV71_ASPNN|nr:hypothetical protein FE257_007657 [Aspergillus nanangensis]
MRRTSARQASLSRGQQPGIQSFARATKPGIAALSSAAENKKAAVTSLPVSPSKKRKLNELENVDCGSPQGRGKGGSTLADDAPPQLLTPSKSLRISGLSVSSPRSGHYVSTRRSSQALPVTDKLEIPVTPSKRTVARGTPRKTSTVLDTRPVCITDLANLHASFQRALTLHAAHHGSYAPAEMKQFLYSVERLWKKRKVDVKDVQRLLWIREQSPDISPKFQLANYGLGRVCLEKVVRQARGDWLNETQSQEQFEQTINLLWEKALDAAEGDESRVEFIKTLGLSSIIESLTPMTAFRKGQQRLQDLKGGVIKLKTERLRAGAPESDTPAKTPEATTARRSGLLDRLRDKALRQSKLPPPPTKEMLIRRAAAQRIEEVASVVALLRPAGYVGTGSKAMAAAQRTPFQLKMVIQRVRDSVRNPISEKEVEACVEILARADVAGQWVELVTVNQMKSVVLKSYADVRPIDIAAKVCQLNIGSTETAVGEAST